MCLHLIIIKTAFLTLFTFRNTFLGEIQLRNFANGLKKSIAFRRPSRGRWRRGQEVTREIGCCSDTQCERGWGEPAAKDVIVGHDWVHPWRWENKLGVRKSWSIYLDESLQLAKGFSVLNAKKPFFFAKQLKILTRFVRICHYFLLFPLIFIAMVFWNARFFIIKTCKYCTKLQIKIKIHGLQISKSFRGNSLHGGDI